MDLKSPFSVNGDPRYPVEAGLLIPSAHRIPGLLHVVHRLADRGAQHTGRVGQGELVAGDVEGLADEPVRLGKDDPGDRRDVVDGDHLQAGRGSQRCHDSQALVAWLCAPGHEVLHEEDRPHDGERQPQSLEVVLDLGLGLKVGDAGLLVGRAHRGIDVVAHAGRRGCLTQRLALGDLVLCASLEGGRHGKDAVDALQRGQQAGFVG